MAGCTPAVQMNSPQPPYEVRLRGLGGRAACGAPRSPAWYYISGPTFSKDGWWMAESGKIQLVCRGGWRFRNSVWIGTVAVQAPDLHMVMAPGHPDF